MRNVTLPTPVFVAGGALCLLAGYLVGAVSGPDRPAQTTATVISYDPAVNRLCLGGSAVKESAGLNSAGHLCGVWRRTSGSASPDKGERFRFVSVVSRGENGAKQTTVIYGDVVR